MTQPVTLRLADDLEKHVGGNIAFRSAAELRRQHEEIKCEERRFGDLWEQFAALDKVNQELVKALRYIKNQVIGSDWTHEQALNFCKATAKEALNKAKGETT
jgi:hypothetical protein